MDYLIQLNLDIFALCHQLKSRNNFSIANPISASDRAEFYYFLFTQCL